MECLTILGLAFVAHSQAASTNKVAPTPKAPSAAAGGKGDPLSTSPDALGAKALLEDLLGKRYSRELGTIQRSEDFTLSARLTLTPTPAEATPPPKTADSNAHDLPLDLTLGTLDPEELIKRYADPVLQPKVTSFLNSYRISKVTMSIGLKPNLDPAVKPAIEKWLNDQLTAEFGPLGKGVVSQLTAPKVEPRTFEDKLNQFQDLAGKLGIALAILLGSIAWALSSKKSSSQVQSESRGGESNASAGQSVATATNATGAGGDTNTSQTQDDSELVRATKEVELLTRQISEMVPLLSTERDNIVRAWAEGGEEGLRKLACFSEAAGKTVGKLSIPSDAVKALSEVFTKMPDFNVKQKSAILSKVYWDIIAAINVGTQSLSKPFGFLANLNSKALNQVLLDQNMRIKTFVSLHMPERLRTSYLKSLDSETKKALLLEAANLQEMTAPNFQAFEGQFKSLLKSDSNSGDTISFEQAFVALAKSLQPSEALAYLPGLQGPGLERYKRSTPSISFFAEWPKDKMASVLSKVMPDELVAYLRLNPELAEEILSLCPPMTSELARDDLNRENRLNEDEINRLLGQFQERINDFATQSGLNLDELFEAATISRGESDDEQKTPQAA